MYMERREKNALSLRERCEDMNESYWHVFASSTRKDISPWFVSSLPARRPYFHEKEEKIE